MHKHKESDVLKTHWKNSNSCTILKNIPVLFFSFCFSPFLFPMLLGGGGMEFLISKKECFTLGHLLGNLKFQTTSLHKIIC